MFFEWRKPDPRKQAEKDNRKIAKGEREIARIDKRIGQLNEVINNPNTWSHKVGKAADERELHLERQRNISYAMATIKGSQEFEPGEQERPAKILLERLRALHGIERSWKESAARRAAANLAATREDIEDGRLSRVYKELRDLTAGL